jgi:hypothetical protein
MKNIVYKYFIVIVIFFALSQLYAQESKIIYDRENNNRTTDTATYFQILSGPGFKYDFSNSSSFRFLISASLYVDFSKLFHLGFGVNFYKSLRNEQTTVGLYFLMPTFKFNLTKNKLDLYAGCGLFAGDEWFGAVLGIRLDYNFNKLLSFGIDIKHAAYYDDHHPLILTNAYIGIKF